LHYYRANAMFLLLQPRKLYANISVKPHSFSFSSIIVAFQQLWHVICDPLHDGHCEPAARCVLHLLFS